MFRKQSVYFGISVLLLALVFPQAEAGWLSKGLRKLGRSVGSTVGSVFGGAADAATRPVIENIEATGQRLISQVDAMLNSRIGQIDALADSKLTKLDGMLDARLNQTDGILKQNLDRVDLIAQSSINELDQLAEERLNQLDQIAETRIVNLDVLFTKTGFNFEQSLLRIIGAGVLILLFAVGLWRLFLQARPHLDGNSLPVALIRGIRSGWLPLLVEGFAVILILGCAYLATTSSWFNPNKKQLEELEAEYRDSYIESYRNYDFNHARFLAAQLQVLRPTENKYRAWREKAELVRDVLGRPGLLDSYAGIAEVTQKLDRLEGLLNPDGQSNPDPDLLGVAAYLFWQLGDDKISEVKAASIAAYALREAQSQRDGVQFNQHVMMPLMLAYLSAFINQPIEETFFQDAQAELEETEPDKVTAIFEFNTMKTIYADSVNLLNSVENSNLQVQFQHVLAYYIAVSELNKTTTQKYIDMLDAHVECRKQIRSVQSTGTLSSISAGPAIAFNAPLPPDLDSNSKEVGCAKRKQLAEEIISEWETFVEFVLQEEQVVTNNTLAALRLNDSPYVTAMWFIQNDYEGTQNAYLPTVDFNQDTIGGDTAYFYTLLLPPVLSTKDVNPLFYASVVNDNVERENSLTEFVSGQLPALSSRLYLIQPDDPSNPVSDNTDRSRWTQQLKSVKQQIEEAIAPGFSVPMASLIANRDYEMYSQQEQATRAFEVYYIMAKESGDMGLDNFQKLLELEARAAVSTDLYIVCDQATDESCDSNQPANYLAFNILARTRLSGDIVNEIKSSIINDIRNRRVLLL